MSDWLQTVLRRPPIEWMDLVDVAIVAVFFYQVLVLIRGTRAMQMAVGAGLVTFLYFLSRWLELEAGSEAEARTQVEEMAGRLLSNPVIEDSRILELREA